MAQRFRDISHHRRGVSPRDQQWSDPDVEPEERAQLVVSRLLRLKQDSTGQRWSWDRYLALYHNTMPLFFNSEDGNYRSPEDQNLNAGMAVNVISRGVDTIVSRLKKNKSRPRFVTSNARDALKRRACGLQQFTDGVVYEQRFHGKSEIVLRDMALLGTGCAKVWDDKEEAKVRIEPVPIADVHVGRVAGLNKQPHEVLHSRIVSRREMMARYPEHADGIASAQDQVLDGEMCQDAVLAIDAYSYEPWMGDEGGRHVMVIGTQWVVDEPWDCPVPFLFVRWKGHARMFHGTGIAFDLLANQIRINRMVQDMAQAVHAFGFPAVFVQRGSNPSREFATDAIGRIVEYDGTRPEVAAPDRVTCAEVMATIRWLVDDAFDQIGLSQMAATGTKEPGITSGVAIREVSDIQSDRFTSVAQAWDELHVELGQRIVDAGKRLYGKGSKVRLLSADGDMNHVDWADIDMEQDAYQLQAFSASTLPTTPAGKLEYVQELLASGFIGQQQAVDLVGNPDVYGAVRLGTASYRAAQRQVDLVMEGSEDLVPDEWMDWRTCMTLANQAYNDVLSRPEPDEDVLDRLREYMRAIEAEQQPPPEPPPPQLPAEGAGGPPVAPGPLPPGPEVGPPMLPEGAPVGAPGGMPPVPAAA